MKLITRDTDYAMRTLVYFAKQESKDVISTSELADKLKIPRPFLRKILRRLSNEGILSSQKGLSGGFVLKRHPDKILLADIMRVFQGEPRLNECIFRKKICPDRRTCPLRKKILPIERRVLSEIKNITVGQLIGRKHNIRKETL